MYTNLADIYDEMYGFKDYAAGANYVRNAIREKSPRSRTLLEAACGTGRFLELFASDFDVEGLDISPGMLEKAARRLPQTPLHLADMTAFDLGKRFDVVCCLFRSIAHCVTVERLNAAIAAMSRHLNEGGVLVIEPFVTPEAFWDNNIVLNEHRGENMKIAWMYVGQREGTVVKMEIHCLLGTPRGVQHFVDAYDVGLFSREDFARAFAEANLRADFDPKGPTGTGLYVASKLAA